MEKEENVDKKKLLLNKHIDFIVGYGKDHDVYVSLLLNCKSIVSNN
jgi:hypothetical protein